MNGLSISGIACTLDELAAHEPEAPVPAELVVRLVEEARFDELEGRDPTSAYSQGRARISDTVLAMIRGADLKTVADRDRLLLEIREHCEFFAGDLDGPSALRDIS